MIRILLLIMFSTSLHAREPINPNRYQHLTGIKKGPLVELNSRSPGKGPDQFLVENFSYLPTEGDILDINSKDGRNATFLASKGYKVTSIQSPEVRSKIKNDTGHSVNWVWTSLKEQNGAKLFYDVIVCFEHLPRKEIEKIKTWLKPGGVFIYETPNFRHPDAKANPNNFAHGQDLIELATRGYSISKFQDPPSTKEFRSSIILRKE